MKTNASNIMLRNLKCEHNLFDRIYFGINGGFFSWTKNGNRYRVLNLAKCDGAVVGPNSDDGISNGWLGGGVIYWDGKYLKTKVDYRPHRCYTLPVLIRQIGIFWEFIERKVN